MRQGLHGFAQVLELLHQRKTDILIPEVRIQSLIG